MSTLRVSEPAVSERKELLRDSMIELKLAFKIAKKDRNKKKIDEARGLADAIIANKYNIGNKDAHMIISAYKLADGGSGTYIGQASSVLDEMISSGVMPDTMIFNNVIDMLAKCRNGSDGHGMALHQLDRMKDLGVVPDLLTYTSIITSCARHDKWKESIQLLDEITTKHNIEPDRVIYTAVIKACSNSGRWREAILMLAKMRETGVPLDSAACNSVITACASAGKWEAALKVMQFMKREGIAIDHYTYSAAISACDEGGQSHLIESLYDEIIAKLEEETSLEKDRFAAPLNTIIKYYARVGEISSAGLEVYKRMIDLDINRNEISYTTLITYLAKEKHYDLIIDLFEQVKEDQKDLEYLVANEAVAGSILHAAAHERVWEVVSYILKLYVSIHLQQGDISFNTDRAKDATDLFNLVLAISCRKEHYEVSRGIWRLMEISGVHMNDDSYTYIILACKTECLWEEAMDILSAWGGTPLSLSSKKVYSACISVLVESKAWQASVSILDEMETKGVTPSEVTYNSAIEALDASEEYVRAELVFQSALRMDGIYANWLAINSDDDPNEKTGITLDLHRLPIAVAKAALRHTLGEMSTGRMTVDDLVVITGRGRGTPSRFSKNQTRGLMRSSVLEFLLRMELITEEMADNPGRLLVRKESLQQWFLEQEQDDMEKRSAGSAHGNLFLSVARAKKSNPGDIRAVCPFSSATEPKSVAAQAPVEVRESPSKCPAHNGSSAPPKADASEAPASRCPAHMHGGEVASIDVHETAVGSPSCPAH